MASDSLNQIGKYIGKTGKNADYALKKTRPNRPPVERTRDIFDENNDFEMEFMVNKNQKRVSLNLNFAKPPPMKGCFDCSPDMGFCEAFHDVPMGDAILPLAHRVFPDSVQVYVNNIWWPPSKWRLLGGYGIDPNPAQLQVFGLPLPLNEVDICYVADTPNNYEGDVLCDLDSPGWQGFSGPDGGGFQFAWPGEYPKLGWGATPVVGPIRYVELGHDPNLGLNEWFNLYAIIPDEDMVVRIVTVIGMNIVAFRYASAKVKIKLNSSTIAIVGQDWTLGGLGYIGGPPFYVEARNVQVRAGDVIWVQGELYGSIDGSFGSPFNPLNTYYFQVVRGDFPDYPNAPWGP